MRRGPGVQARPSSRHGFVYATLANGQSAKLPPPQVVAGRFPRLPVQPVIPAVARALAVTKVCGNVIEAVRFMLWLLGPDGQSLVGAAQLQSVRSDMPTRPSPVPGVVDLGGLTADAANMFAPDAAPRYEVQTRALLVQAAQNPTVLSEKGSRTTS